MASICNTPGYIIIGNTVNEPLVSVAILTYNHDKYIAASIESVIKQKITFSMEVVIAEDASNDKTREIVTEYQNTYPEKIRVILQKRNIGPKLNKFCLLSNLKGKFIATLEGDDYWTDDFKLQKQIDFLQNNLDYSFSMGKVEVLFEKTGVMRKKKEYVKPGKKDFFTLKDYLKYPFSHTSTFVFRRSDLEFPDWFSKVHAGDQSLVVIATRNNKIKYHDDFFSVYRINQSGITNSRELQKYKQEVFFYLNHANEYTDYKYNRIIVLRKIRVHFIALQANAEKKWIFFVLRIFNNILLQILRIFP